MKLTIRRVVITACSLGLGHLISCHYVSPNRSRPGLYDIESINWKWKMEPISWLPGCPWGQTPDFIHPIDQFFGYWVAEPVFVKKTWQHTRLCFFFFFTFLFLPKPPLLHRIFQTTNTKWFPYQGAHSLLGAGSVYTEFGPGLLLASTCHSLCELCLFKPDRSFRAEPLMDVGKLLKACVDCLFFFFWGVEWGLAWHHCHEYG